MYEAHFQLHRRPFAPSADVSTYVGVGPVEQAGQTLLRVVGRGSGPALVIGSSGTGKSMLCELLAEHFGEQLQVALLANGQLANPKALYQAVLFELGLPYRDMDENELRLSLVEFLTDSTRCPQGLLLIVDEAHCLPLRILEEIRMLTNLVRDGQSRIHLVLAGGAALEERFTSPKLDSFNQRVAARCYLESLNREETATYITEQITAAGGNGSQAFHGDALSAVYDATDGIPRLVNQVCDHALIMAAIGGHDTVTADIVQEAWADLQQLPAPWVEPSSKGGTVESGQHVIEFGTLDDEEAAPSVPFVQEQVEEVAEEKLQPAAVAEMQLDKIDDQIAAVNESYEAAETEVEVAAELEVEAEIEVAKPPAANPFAESFDEEEVIVDSYAALQETRFANAPRVTSHEGRAIAAMLSQAPVAASAVTNEAFVPTVPVTEEEQVDEIEPAAQQRQNELTDAVSSLLETIDEPVIDETPIDESEDDAVAEIHPISRATTEPVAAPIDDRDLIIVDDADEVEAPKLVATGQARRQKYRQLFNRLRQA